MNRKFFWDKYLQTNTRVSKYIHSPPHSPQLFSSSHTHTPRTPQSNQTRIFKYQCAGVVPDQEKTTTIVSATAELEHKGEGWGGKQQKAAPGSRDILIPCTAWAVLPHGSSCLGHGQQVLRAPGPPPPPTLCPVDLHQSTNGISF